MNPQLSTALLQFDLNNLLNTYTHSNYIPSVRTFTNSIPHIIYLQDPLFVMLKNQISLEPLLSLEPRTPNELHSSLVKIKNHINYETLYHLGHLILYSQNKNFTLQEYDACSFFWKDVYTLKNLRLYMVYRHRDNQEFVLEMNLIWNEILESIRIQHVSLHLFKDPSVVGLLGKNLIISFFTIQEFYEYSFKCQIVMIS